MPSPGHVSELARREQRLFASWRNDVDELARAYLAHSATATQPAGPQPGTSTSNASRSTDFKRFHSLFLAAHFPSIFTGRLAVSELMEFSEYLLSYAASYMCPHACVDREGEQEDEECKARMRTEGGIDGMGKGLELG